MTDISVAELIAETERAWEIVRGHIADLTDDELLWEPVAGMWTLRRGHDGLVDNDWAPDPSIAPPTTAGWRLCHFATSLHFHRQRLFDPGFAGGTPQAMSVLRSVLADARVAGTAEGAMRFAQTGYERWAKAIRSSGDVLPAPLAAQVRIFNSHSTHHATEVGVLRHLYRWSRPLDAEPFVDACLRGDGDRMRSLAAADAGAVARLAATRTDLVVTAARMGRWQVVETLVELGFPADGPEGATALHYAAGYGPPQTVRRLVELGADVNRRDPHFDATPLGWAEYAANATAMEFLRGPTTS